MTAPTDWKSLAEEEAVMDEECPVVGCTNRARHRGRHNKRGLLPTERAEVDKLTKKRGRSPGVIHEGTEVPIRDRVEVPVSVALPEPVVITVELLVSVRVVP